MQPNPTEPSAIIAIQSSDQCGEQPLLEGDRVVFTVSVRAQGFDKPSEVGLVVQTEGKLLGSAPHVPIKTGETVTLQVPVAIPQENSVQVLTPLYIGMAMETSVIDLRNYRVLGRWG